MLCEWINMKEEKKCKSCYGHGFWAWGDICPVGQIDAEDGVPTIKCPECGADTNPLEPDEEDDNVIIESKKRYEQIEKLFDDGKLLFGTLSKDNEYYKLREEINK